MKSPYSWLAISFSLLSTSVAEIDYKKDVKPIFEKRCVECHSTKMKKPKGGYKFDDDASIKNEIGPSFLIKPGDPANSVLMEMVNRTAKDHNMPPDAKDALSPRELKILSTWIEEGANMEKSSGGSKSGLGSTSSSLPSVQEWTNKEGKVIKASIVKIKGDNVTLRIAGKEYTMPLSSLNEDSQKQAMKLAGEMAVKGK
jgi:mono/diheme cytochrome c family protein